MEEEDETNCCIWIVDKGVMVNLGGFSIGFVRLLTIAVAAVTPSTVRKIHNDRQMKLEKVPLRDNGELSSL